MHLKIRGKTSEAKVVTLPAQTSIDTGRGQDNELYLLCLFVILI